MEVFLVDDHELAQLHAADGRIPSAFAHQCEFAKGSAAPQDDRVGIGEQHARVVAVHESDRAVADKVHRHADVALFDDDAAAFEPLVPHHTAKRLLKLHGKDGKAWDRTKDGAQTRDVIRRSIKRLLNITIQTY